MNFTASQQEVVHAEGNVLVLAGAGTGKTHTMVERCLDRLFHPTHPIYLDQILMVTFTEAAAAEMKRRIAEKLNQRFDAETLAGSKAAAKIKQRVAEQLALLDAAEIGTLHSIALGLILQHSHELRLSPQLRTLSPAERDALQKEALAETLDAGCRATSPSAESIHQWMRQAGANKVRAWILQLHTHTQLLPAPEQWMRRQRQHYEVSNPDLWLRWLSEALSQWSDAFLPALKNGAESCPNLQSCIDALETLPAALAQPDKSNAADCFRNIAAADQAWPQGQKTRARKPLKEFFQDALFFESLFWDKEENQPGLSPLLQDWEQCRRQILALLQLTEDFQKRFRKRKKEQEALDFHDMEQFALDLLCGRDRAGETEIAREMQARFEYVFADEYQDITQAQDAILRALCRQGDAANLFLVGDEKQSIYRFRGATPKLLQHYKSDWERRPKSAVVHLQDNFRSHPQLLRFINGFCASLSQQSAGFPYDAGDQLLPASFVDNSINPDAGPPVEFHLALKPKEKEGRADARTLEAHIIARRIRSLIDGKTEVLDAGAQKLRSAKWSDFAILLRSLTPTTRANSPAGAARLLSQVFRHYEIPVQMPADNFFDLPEIQDLLALLKILDNPFQNIPLLAVLRSPFCGLTPDELAVVRLAQPKGHFWQALRRFRKNPAEDNSPQLQTLQKNFPNQSKTWLAEAQKKCGQFLTNYQRWKLAGRTHSIPKRVQLILAESYYLEALSSQTPWRNPQAQVQQFLQLARDFERQSPPDLARFLQSIDELRQSKHEIEPVPQETVDAVQLMSIHKSKGLEFPIVILANLDKRFNTEDIRQPLILDNRYGLCWTLQLPGTAQTYPSPPYWLGKKKQREKLIAEEARLLYVALTRARERLLLTGAATEQTLLKTWPKHSNPSPETNLSQRANSFLDWLAPWLVRQTRLASDPNLAQSAENGIHWQIHSNLAEDEPKPPKPNNNNAPPKPTSTDENLQTLRQRLNWRYPFLTATTQRAKASASILKQQSQLDDDVPSQKPLPPKFKIKKPKSEDHQRESAQTRGQAWHGILQFLPPDQATNVENARAAIQTLLAQNRLEPSDPETIQLHRIIEFWTSETGTQIRNQNSRHLRRELKFTAQFTNRQLRKLGFDIADNSAIDNVPMIIQGAVDLALIQPQELWILDFKSDKIQPQELPERTLLHTPQLALYRAALQKIYQRPVTSAWIHFLHLNTTTAPLNPPLSA